MSGELRNVVLMTHPTSEEAAGLAHQIEHTLRGAGVCVSRNGKVNGRDAALPPETDLLVAVGGDGTVLRSQRVAVPERVPVLGVSAGRLGFLAETDAEGLAHALDRLLGGHYREEPRALLDIEHLRGEELLVRYTALNDAVLARGAKPRSLWIDVHVNGVPLGHYIADGVIAATATGSTAYSLASGGPILAPELRDYVLTPIAAHLSIVHSTVLPEDTQVELQLMRPQDAALSVDGQADAPVRYGERLRVGVSDQVARFIRLSPPNTFYSQLVSRLQHNLERSRPASAGSNPL